MLLDLVVEIVGSFLGELPERQPWRALLIVIYLVAGGVAIAALVWIVATAI